MRTLVLDGTGSEGLLRSIEDASKKAGFETDSVDLVRSSVKGCQSCFSCWVRTPGECALDDDGKIVVRKFVNSDLVVFVSPTMFGTYSPQLKRALERLLPVAMPYFRKINGDIRHPLRYKKRPGLLVIGQSSTQPEDANFRDLVVRNAKSLDPRFLEIIVLDGKEDDKMIGGAFERAKGGIS